MLRERLEVADGVRGALKLRLRDALHQRHAGAVEVDQGIRAARDSPVARTRVGRFAGVFF